MMDACRPEYLIQPMAATTPIPTADVLLAWERSFISREPTQYCFLPQRGMKVAYGGSFDRKRNRAMHA